MEALGRIVTGWQIANAEGLVILLAIITLIYLFAARARAGKNYALRRIEGFAAIQQAVGQAAELGKPLHVSLGVGGIGNTTTLETFAGLSALEYLAQQAALCNTPLLVSVADPTSLPAAQAALYRAHAQAGYPEEYNPNKVRFIALDPVAYAAGVMSTLKQEKLAANIMIGHFGDEFLLMGETGNQKLISQVGGAANPRVLPAVYVSMEHTLIGEEIFAAGAYLLSNPNHIGALVAQDVMRAALVLTALVGIALKTLGIL